MLITRETDYALRALRALADGRKKTLAAICKEETIPQQFGYKILKKLAHAGYVDIKRGKEGGYTISGDFPKFTLLDLTKVMESPTDISPCVIPGYVCESHRAQDGPCKVNRELSAMQENLNAQLDGIHLHELLVE
ncbi:MAG: Rrf2 family transcriptional regulator [Clostridiales Family XIII bacterium]|jgi:Rrf2 family protein|nr:Rrf2 family transcriptional regulator [Clostridiales Family XIII bacterium]